jgi:hypothetical protein
MCFRESCVVNIRNRTRAAPMSAPPANFSAGAPVLGCSANHSFRATGITAYAKNSGTLEKAAAIANHASIRTTQLYDRRRGSRADYDLRFSDREKEDCGWSEDGLA